VHIAVQHTLAAGTAAKCDFEFRCPGGSTLKHPALIPRGPTLITVIDPATLKAYRETEYRVLGDEPVTLRVAVACAGLALLHERYRTDCSAFLTACNPLGEIVAAAVNAQRREALAQEVSRRGLTAIAGIGQHPTNGWPGEISLLVLGLTRAAAQALGRRFEQNAIIWSGANAVPELVLLR
jgi:hypothetical protein